MTITKYSYTKEVNTPRLKSEIASSSITIALDHVEKNGEALDVYFKDALSDQSLLDALISAHINTPLPEQDTTNQDGMQIVEVRSPKGRSASIPSHNFCDRTTWVTKAVRVSGESPSEPRSKFFVLNHTGIIDSTHGKITFENRDTSNILQVYDNGVELVEGQDFQCNFDMGIITLADSFTPTGAITVDYSYATTSDFELVPDSGETLLLSKSEIQFSGDISMRPVHFIVYVNDIEVQRDTYKNLDNIIDVARNGTGSIAPVDNIKTGRRVFPVVYDDPIELQSAINMKLVVTVDGDQPMGGERATITFYGRYQS